MSPGAAPRKRFFSLTRPLLASSPRLLLLLLPTSVTTSPPHRRLLLASARLHCIGFPPMPPPPPSSPTMATHSGLPLLLTVLLLQLVALAPTTSAACTSTYTLRVKTSCGSPSPRTTSAVSVAFGDAYRNEVLARPLVPATSRSKSRNRALERCGTDTFRVAGPCGYGVCYLYLRRDGRDGWAPQWVQVVQPGPRDEPPATATFYFGDPLPDGVWYGHERCPKAAAADAADADADAAGTNSTASPRG